MKILVLFILLFAFQAQALTVNDVVGKHYYDNQCAGDLKKWSVWDTADDIQMNDQAIIMTFGTDEYRVEPMKAAFSSAEYTKMYEDELRRGWRPLGVILEYEGKYWLGWMLPVVSDKSGRTSACAPVFLKTIDAFM